MDPNDNLWKAFYPKLYPLDRPPHDKDLLDGILKANHQKPYPMDSHSQRPPWTTYGRQIVRNHTPPPPCPRQSFSKIPSVKDLMDNLWKANH